MFNLFNPYFSLPNTGIIIDLNSLSEVYKLNDLRYIYARP